MFPTSLADLSKPPQTSKNHRNTKQLETKLFTVLYRNNIGFLVGFLGFCIFLGWIFWDLFGDFWGDVLRIF